jgi:hypothetical protein
MLKFVSKARVWRLDWDPVGVVVGSWMGWNVGGCLSGTKNQSGPIQSHTLVVLRLRSNRLCGLNACRCR